MHQQTCRCAGAFREVAEAQLGVVDARPRQITDFAGTFGCTSTRSSGPAGGGGPWSRCRAT
jgi:hypothetical protein